MDEQVLNKKNELSNILSKTETKIQKETKHYRFIYNPGNTARKILNELMNKDPHTKLKKYTDADVQQALLLVKNDSFIEKVREEFERLDQEENTRIVNDPSAQLSIMRAQNSVRSTTGQPLLDTSEFKSKSQSF